MRTVAVLLIVLSISGCCAHHPLYTVARAHIINENKSTLPPPVDHSCKVSAVPVNGSACDTRIALIDVDDIILNQNYTGAATLGENPVALFREKLDAAAADPATRAVVLRINSPGGSVTATDTMWRDLQDFRARRKVPVVACLMDCGTGGAYYLACASDMIIAQPTTITGGIGVILNLYNLHDLMAQYNIIPQEVKAGENIDMGTSARNLPEAAKELLQSMADEFHQRFIRIVREARPQVENQAGTFDGRVFTAQQALKLGLVDRVGYLDDAIGIARNMVQSEAAQVVLYRRSNNVVHSQYAVVPNIPVQQDVLYNLPGADRRRLPAFLYMWQPEITLEKQAGR